MSKAQNRNMGRKRRQGNTIPQKANNTTIEDLMESEEDESPVANVKRMMIRMYNEHNKEHKEDTQEQLNESPDNKDKKIEKTQKQLYLERISTNSETKLRRFLKKEKNESTRYETKIWKVSKEEKRNPVDKKLPKSNRKYK
jgi:uncharacterized protein (DUF1697 family)